MDFLLSSDLIALIIRLVFVSVTTRSSPWPSSSPSGFYLFQPPDWVQAVYQTLATHFCTHYLCWKHFCVNCEGRCIFWVCICAICKCTVSSWGPVHPSKSWHFQAGSSNSEIRNVVQFIVLDLNWDPLMRTVVELKTKITKLVELRKVESKYWLWQLSQPCSYFWIPFEELSPVHSYITDSLKSISQPKIHRSEPKNVDVNIFSLTGYVAESLDGST